MSAGGGDENLMKLVFYSGISVGNYLIVLAKFNLIYTSKNMYKTHEAHAPKPKPKYKHEQLR